MSRPSTVARSMAEAEVRPASGGSAGYERTADWLLLTLAFLIVGASFKTTEVLTVGDWDMWIDWKDREWWPLLFPLICIAYPAFVQAIFWKYFRLPFGATFAVVGLHLVTLVTLWTGHVGWTRFPWTLVWGATLIPGAILLDTVLLLTASPFLTAIGGAALYSIVFYPANWPMLAPYRLVVEHMGQLATVADVIGYTFTRTSMPEYLRIIERGTLRTFGENPAVISALFSGFLSVIMYAVWFYLGSRVSDLPRLGNVYRRYMGLER
jgi:methane/ammonia monooxygenase subunit A